jgi:hypothetical protein
MLGLVQLEGPPGGHGFHGQVHKGDLRGGLSRLH